MRRQITEKCKWNCIFIWTRNGLCLAIYRYAKLLAVQRKLTFIKNYKFCWQKVDFVTDLKPLLGWVNMTAVVVCRSIDSNVVFSPHNSRGLDCQEWKWLSAIRRCVDLLHHRDGVVQGMSCAKPVCSYAKIEHNWNETRERGEKDSLSDAPVHAMHQMRLGRGISFTF